MNTGFTSKGSAASVSGPTGPIPMGPTPIKVCLCGSTRWPREFESATEAETRAGKIVLSVGLFGHQQGIDMQGDLKKMLDNLHLHKIVEADEILVLNRPVVECLDCGSLDDRLTAVECQECQSGRLRRYNRIGESTAREIAFARSRGKRVRFRYEFRGKYHVASATFFKSSSSRAGRFTSSGGRSTCPPPRPTTCSIAA
jgi:Zn finger protein HypA/HybF involved in hydrogenase expression